MRHVPRLYIGTISIDREFVLDEFHAKHIAHVLRKTVGDELLAFNELQGEYRCAITRITKREVFVSAISKVRDYVAGPTRLAIAFGVIEYDRVRWLVEKATELGVHEIIPLRTRYSKSSIDLRKLSVVAMCAAEQCERLDVPVIHGCTSLDVVLSGAEFCKYCKISCIERSYGDDLFAVELDGRDKMFVIGPAGGFCDEEISALRNCSDSCISLGANILRTETAAIKCLCMYL